MHALASNDFSPGLVLDQERIPGLVERAQRGDDKAFEELLQMRYVSLRLFLIYMVANDEVGNDLLQETFLKAWQSLPSLRDPARFDSWLYSIARRLALNYLRRSRLFVWLPWHEDGIDTQVTTTRFEQHVEERLLLKQALARVQPRYRACLILQVVHGMPQRQIAELLGIKKESVSTFVHRGLQQLQEAYLRLEQA
jgi:RNA polymerase sigma-70 factor (ECF subfamily)